MSSYVKLYLVVLAAFLAIDLLWLGYVARGFYRKHLGYVLAENPNWPAAFLFYLLFVLGVLVFVVVPALNSGPLRTMLPRAALFGLIAYATYDLTNLAFINNYSLTFAFVDMAWGTFLCAAISTIGLKASIPSPAQVKS